jgi:hypothetical protein
MALLPAPASARWPVAQRTTSSSGATRRRRTGL